MDNNGTLKVKRILSFLVFAVLLVIAVRACTLLTEHKSSRIKYTDFLDNDTEYDCFLMGTSITLNSLLPMEMWKDYGIASYNFGSSNCTPAEDYYILREAMKYKKPKLVVIDMMGVVEFNDIGNGKYMWTQVEAQHTQFDCFPLSRTKAEAVNDLFDIYEDRNDFLWSYIMFHNRWSELEEQDFNWKNMLNVEKGALTNTGTLGKAYSKSEPTGETISLKGVNYDYFIRLVEYCRQEGVDVLAIYLPHPVETLNRQVANSIGAVAAQYDNLEYINMLDLDILDYDTDFTSDNTHPNLSGALKLTDYIGQYIREHYELRDHSSDAAWLKSESKYHEYKKENIISQKALPYYLVQLSDDEFTASAYIYNKELTEDEWLMELFDNAGIKPEYKNIDTDKNADKETNTDTDLLKDADAMLDIRDAVNGETIEKAYFKYQDDTDHTDDTEAEDRDIFKLIKITEEDTDASEE